MENTMISRELMLMEEMEFNLSDFAFFLSVTRNKEAYESMLSIIMENPDVTVKD